MKDVPGRSRRRTGRWRIALTGVVAAALAVTGAVIATTASAEPDKTVTTNQTGSHNGFFYSFWKDSGNVTMTLGANGQYSTSWNGINNWVGGKGWATGGRKVVNYSGTFNPGNNGYLALYGWTRNPLVEYYVVENFGNYNPSSGAQRMGSVDTDGGTYEIFRSQRVNQPSIDGTATFYQYWSVRTVKRTGGTITTGNHFDAWAKAGMNLGTHNYMIMATEGYQSTGSSNITVSEGPAPSQPTVQPSAQPSTQPTTQPGTQPTGGSGGCTVAVTRSQEWGDRFNVNLAVSGSSAWTVRIGLNGGQSLQNSWNAAVSGTSGTLTATPNGNGNTFGITVYKNGSTTLPTATCSAPGGSASQAPATSSTATSSAPPSSTSSTSTSAAPTGGGPSSCSAGYVGLTFDDGPTAGTTNQLISTLRQYGATGTVFPTGSNVQANPALVRAYRDAGLQIGNHSWDHPHLTTLSQSQIQSQLSRTQTAIQQAAGVTPTLFRPPYGETNATLRSVESSLGLREVIWDVDSTDWNNASAATIRQVAGRLTNGQIILMHDWPAATLQALPGILQDLRSRNLCTGHISPATGRAVAPSGSRPGGGTTPAAPTATATTTSTGGGTTCSVSVTRGQEWGDRFNVNLAVSGSSAWTVRIGLNGGQSLQNSWNARVQGTGGTLTATPNGNGNTFGITVYKNGSTTIPTATCTA